MTAEFPDFDDFYTAANDGQRPFPWQSRLASTVVQAHWPGTIGIPTGMGKTACIDVAVWALAHDAFQRGAKREAATRIWYVVNRRLLVDEAYRRGCRIAQLLANPSTVGDARRQSALEAISGALHGLASISSEGGPLHVSRLRGGADLGERPPAPSHPALIFATVPMFASRLLFRGYGSSHSMQPIDAALAGIDSLVLLDEAHLAAPLMNLVRMAAECDTGDAGTLLVPPRARPRLIALTATGEADDERFDLDIDDECSPLIAERLTAFKPVELATSTKASMAATMAARAAELSQSMPSGAGIIFCNSVDLARKVSTELERRTKAAPVLVTGRMRDREADAVRSRLLDPEVGAPSGRPTGTQAAGFIAVSTQTLEVGADLDFDFLVTESAAVRSLIQRFGRLNRLGRRPHARGVICHAADDKGDGVYGLGSKVAWDRLQWIEGPINLAPALIEAVLGKPDDVPPRAGELLAEHLWEFAKTSMREPGEPPVEVFFDELGDDSKTVSVAWREVLPELADTRLIPALDAAEGIEVPIGELRKALRDRPSVIRRLRGDRASLEMITVDGLRPGDTILLPSSAGLYDIGGWSPDAANPVIDVGILRSGVLWLDTNVIGMFIELDVDDRQRLQAPIAGLGADDLDHPTRRSLLSSIRDLLEAGTPRFDLTVVEWLDYLARVDWSTVVVDNGYPAYCPGITTRRGARMMIRADSFDDLSFAATNRDSPLLEDHLVMVGNVARRVAESLTLPERVSRCIELAGRLHDLGKYDLRFQRQLDPNGTATAALAKSSVRLELSASAAAESGWPRGGRHELLSTRLAKTWLEDLTAIEGGGPEVDPDLLLHLIVSHHGHGRPWVAVAGDPYPVRVSASIDAARVIASGDLSVPDWSQASRFRRCCERYGVWGIALLEAVLRQADHVASGQVRVA